MDKNKMLLRLMGRQDIKAVDFSTMMRLLEIADDQGVVTCDKDDLSAEFSCPRMVLEKRLGRLDDLGLLNIIESGDSLTARIAEVET